MAARHLITGKSGEEAAVRYLRGKGYKVLDTNWRHGGLEIDIICLHKDTVVFVEVKTKSQGGLGQPADGLDKKKQSRLIKAASFYLSKHDWWERPCRFDLVGVTHAETGFQLEHVPNAFEASQTVRRGHTAWQPW